MKTTWTVLILIVAGCAGGVFRTEPKTPEELYARAVEDTDDGLYPEAMQAFSILKSKYPYSKFAALADLGIADVSFEGGQYIEAVDAYRNFLKYYPQHDKAPYAMYRIAAAYKEQIPANYFFLPPAAEKDQASTRLAITAYKDMLTRFPDSEAAKTARTDLDECRRGLADHELYVAEFYFDRERWLAAAGRAEGLVRDYSGLGLDAKALLIAAESRAQLREWESAFAWASRLKKEFPESDESERAAELLNEAESKRAKQESTDTDDPPRKG